MEQKVELAKIYEKVEHIWSLVRDAHVYEAKTKSEQLIQDIQTCIKKIERGGRPLLTVLAHAYHVAGYVASMSSRDHETLAVIQYFQEMENIASTLHDNTLFVIALTYKGDTYRRRGDLTEAMINLKAAYTHTPQTDVAALGNCAQLLARVYFQVGDLENAERMMAEAEKIAHSIDPIQNRLHGQYCLGTVYIDYARCYIRQGQTQKALDYFHQAETLLPSTPHWSTLLTATQGILLVRSGDIQNGMTYILKALQLGQEHGNKRLIDHFYTLQSYLEQKGLEIREAKALLSDALDSSLEP